MSEPGDQDEDCTRQGCGHGYRRHDQTSKEARCRACPCPGFTLTPPTNTRMRIRNNPDVTETDLFLLELAQLHAPVDNYTEEVIEEDGAHRDVEPGSFESITSHERLCMTCAGYPEWPCLQASLLMQHGGVEFESQP